MHCLPTRSQFFPREDGSVQGDDIRTMVKRLGSVLKFRRQNSLAMLENLSKVYGAPGNLQFVFVAVTTHGFRTCRIRITGF